ncbi:hypothetical protein ACIO6T_41265 [Streptomyces sp. NPDC087532]|uniref:hypothetical protein n=1 Tax=unclassified Streptomyces TaxID=2593676 RepID=UPI00342BED6B
MTTHHHAETYPGELSMLRGLLGVMQVVAKHGDMGEVRRVLAEHASDEQAAYAEEKDTAAEQQKDTLAPAGAAFTAERSALELQGLLYEAITRFQGTAQLTGLGNAQIRQYLAEHIHIALTGDEFTTGYTVTQLDVATEYAEVAE